MKFSVAFLLLLSLSIGNAVSDSEEAVSDSKFDQTDQSSEQQQQQQQLQPDSAASQQYSSYSAFEGEEFGLRKQPDEPNYDGNFDGTLGVNYGSEQSGLDEVESQPTSNYIRGNQSPFGENDGGGGGGGHQQEYFSKAAGSADYQDNSGEGGGGGGGGEPVAFTPVALSVEEAFSKYFPASPMKKDDRQERNQQGFQQGQQSYQQQQQQQQQAQQFGQQQQDPSQQQQQPGADLFNINIDSLREIVEKQPLAKPNPYDPPSPPLSAFLPPPPNSQLVETSGGSGQQQAPSAVSSSESQSMSQYSQQQQQQQQQQFQFQQPQPEFQAPPAQPQSSMFYTKAQVSEPVPLRNQDQPGPGNSEMDEDEGLPYATDNVDENGKGMFVYSRAVHLPDIASQFERPNEPGYVPPPPPPSLLPDVPSPSLSQMPLPASGYNSPISESYRKFEANRPEEPKQSMVTEVHTKRITGGSTVTIEGPGNQYDSNRDQFRPITPPPPPSTPEPENKQYRQQNFNREPSQQTNQWSASENRQPMSGSGPAHIEYGGFTPIKTPVSGVPKYYTEYREKSQNSAPKVPPYEMGVQNSPQQQHQGPYFDGQMSSPPPQSDYQPPPTQPPFQNSQYNNNNDNYERPPPDERPVNFNGNNNNLDNFNLRDYNNGPNGNYGGSSNYNNGPNENNGYNREREREFNSGNYNDRPGLGNFNRRPQEDQQPNQEYQTGRYRALYGKNAAAKLKELGINENEFYGTVNKILQKSYGPSFGKGNNFGSKYVNRPYAPKANMYRSPPKNNRRPYLDGPKKRPLNNQIGEEFDFNILKDELPPGASYNPRDVGLDESVLAQLHLLDSGIGGYRFPPMYPNGNGPRPNQPPPPPPSAPKPYLRPGGLLSRRPSVLSPVVPYKKAKDLSAFPASMAPSAIPYAMNSMLMPIFFTNPASNAPMAPFQNYRMPYSGSGKGFRSQYGYRAAASELKPQFILPKPSKPFQFLTQPVSASQLTSLLGGVGANSLTGSGNNNSGSSSSNGGSSGGILSSAADINGPFGNIFGIRSIKGIKSLVSYLTGGISG